jgi:sugar phosphate isomerase/epimerase
MTPKLACADFAFPLLPHDQVFDLIAMLGLDGVDIGLFPDVSHFHHTHFLGRAPVAAKELSAKVRDRGLEFADFFHQSRPDFEQLAENQPDPGRRQKARDIFLRTLEFVTLCEAKHMMSLPGIHFESESHEDSLRRAADELAWRAERAREAGVVYSVEPHMWSVASTPELAVRLVDMAPGLTITLDYGHYVAQGFTDSEIECLWPVTSHFHARCAANNRLQASMAKNTIDWSRVVRAAGEAGYEGYFGLEYVIMDRDIVENVDPLSETIRLRDVLRKEGG